MSIASIGMVNISRYLRLRGENINRREIESQLCGYLTKKLFSVEYKSLSIQVDY